LSSFTFEGNPVEFSPGESVLVALLRAGTHPTGGGCLCLSGDCPHCIAKVDGVAYMRTCQTKARPGMVIERHPHDGLPDLVSAEMREQSTVQHRFCDVVVIGGGESGTAEASLLVREGRQVVVVDAERGEEAVGIYQGPLVVVRTDEGMEHLHAAEVVVATGSSQLQPICPGSHLEGILTESAAVKLREAGLDLGEVVTVDSDNQPVRFDGDGRVRSVTIRSADGKEKTLPCRTVIVSLGTQPRDGLARMGAGLAVRTIGDAAVTRPLPAPPQEGVVCPCEGVTVDDLASVWDRGFHELELIKRATLAGTGTCQGAVCVPHVRSFIAARAGETPAPFTARPLTRQVTIAEASAGYHLPHYRRTALHDEHVRLGGRMDRFGAWWRPWNYGDTMAEYWAVRQGVSVMDVGTLGKMIVSGPGAVELLERIYPCRVSDLAPGRSRYALLLDERGYVFDDGLICRDGPERFILTFTSGGASFAEMWIREWAETFEVDVRLMDRTMSWGAINVTGPRSKEFLRRAGFHQPPSYMGHTRAEVSGVPCRVFRLGFTGEMSFELHHPAHLSVQLWRSLLELGEDMEIRPHGIEALFKLRLEKGHVIVAMDTDFDSTPRRLGMDWAAKMDKPFFIGSHALMRLARLPLDKQLVGLEMDGPAPIEGSVLWSDGELVGQATSSHFSPVLGKTVMLGWLRLMDGMLPGRVVCDGRQARRVATPFYDPEGTRARA
jgi:glycine cleavage system aminomethyltransferase T/bacterioferritin-associated ferredoxin